MFTNVYTLAQKPTIQHTDVYSHRHRYTNICTHTGMHRCISTYRHVLSHTDRYTRTYMIRDKTSHSKTGESYELSGLPELDFLPALVPQELSRLLEAVRPEQELQRPRGFGWQKS